MHEIDFWESNVNSCSKMKEGKRKAEFFSYEANVIDCDFILGPESGARLNY